MTNHPLDEDEIRQEEMRLLLREMAELEEEFERQLDLERLRLEMLLQVLAAVLIAKHTGGELNLPDIDVFADETMKWLSLHDPLFFVAALTSEAEACQEDLADLAFVAQLLLRARHHPNRRAVAGDNLGRDLLILAAMEALDHLGQGRARENDTSGNATAHSLAEALSDRLNQIETLSRFTDIAPSADRFREIWSNRQAFIARAKPPAPVSDIGWGWRR
ncbi:hypothetical protein [Paracoccus fontiphilus]|uniref:Uncharacterized protein n=1 Tax=Paracoccus fontiphilus TaxID=1815556 RepID=A0ABV7IGR9_9RHOB|nr:hypothetical protein [Paracoccus fontiphilus]